MDAEELGLELKPSPQAEQEPRPPPAQVGGSGSRLFSRPGADSGLAVLLPRAASRRRPRPGEGGAGKKGAPGSLPRSPDRDGIRDPAERGGGSGARPLTRPHAQQQLLRVQPQLLHGEGEDLGRVSPTHIPTRSPCLTLPHPGT